MSKLFDSAETESKKQPLSLAGPVKVVAPFPKGETKKRRRELEAEGYTIIDGGAGPTVFNFSDRY
jgi:hypothetical protein